MHIPRIWYTKSKLFLKSEYLCILPWVFYGKSYFVKKQQIVSLKLVLGGNPAPYGVSCRWQPAFCCLEGVLCYASLSIQLHPLLGGLPQVLPAVETVFKEEPNRTAAQKGISCVSLWKMRQCHPAVLSNAALCSAPLMGMGANKTETKAKSAGL